KLDDIFITHIHADHLDINFVKRLVNKFPDVRITSTSQVVEHLKEVGIIASNDPPEGVEFFEAPHENVQPVFEQPENIGIHYLGLLTDPGDSHRFSETKSILALPITAPWGGSIAAMNLVLELKPKYVIPIHDWHWSTEAREQTYSLFERMLGEKGITFYKAKTGESIDIHT
ncbi:MAG: MBL fold metallo-hydrolase, partial [Candidatus Saccharimonadales bacterium]